MGTYFGHFTGSLCSPKYRVNQLLVHVVSLQSFAMF